MNFECKLCENTYFASNKETWKHLKQSHGIKEKKDQIECTVKNSKCGKFFQTFQGLSRHVSTCAIETEASSCDDCANVPEIEDNAYIFDVSYEGAQAVPDTQDESIICNEASEKERERSFVFNSSTQTCYSIADNFLMGLLTLKMNEKTTNDVFRLAGTLLKDTQRFLQEKMAENDENLQESVNCAMNFVCDDLRRFNSSFKRTKFLQTQPTFVKPRQVVIGTHWETKHDKNSQFRTKTRQQSTFHLLSPLKIIQKLFDRPHFRETYFTYNQKTKHVCEPNVYKDFCCGKIYKKIDLFEKYPESLQLQFFVDGFEVCSALKTKTGLHSQVGVYMSIRNMPQRFSYNMDNIILICLINDNDLKKAETSYNNVWKEIVHYIQILETTGVDIGDGISLRGNIFIFILMYYYYMYLYGNFSHFQGTIVNVTFDNLGGNVSLGFPHSFSAKYFCRMCECTNLETKIATTALPEKYRDIAKYNEVIQIIKDSSEVNIQETKGVAEYCVLNDLKYFHILENWTADVMHDLCEGIINVALENFFNLGMRNKVFSESMIKSRVANYSGYGVLNKQFFPSEVKLTTKNLNQSASQMKCKHHLTLHYSEIIRRSGPLSHMSTLR